MAYEYILTEKRDNISIITLNRPEKRNAINSEMWAEITNALDEFEADEDARVLVITNNGPCFCAGSDLKAISAGTYHPPVGRDKDGFAGICGRHIEKPVIAAVNGMCFGGGAEILLACDLAVISSDCTIGYPEVKRNLLAAGGGALMRLAQAIPVKYAMELLLTGEEIDAEKAVAWGLANRVAEPGQVLDEACKLAAAIAKNGPIAIRRTKELVYECMNAPWIADNNLIWNAILASDLDIKKTEDAAEGELAFAEKREPVWKNR